jgi:UDP-3-O-[3-hydroxymyristoyl] glucosamine N-acyltransferase
MNAEAETEPQVEVRYHTVPCQHADSYPLEVMSQILNGRTGRLYKSMVEGSGVASDAGARQDSRKYAGAFSFSAEVKGGATPRQLEDGWYAALTRLRDRAREDGHAVLYDDVHVGAGSIIHAGASIRERCVIGARCIVGPNAAIGGDGFGYRASPDGRSVLRVPHLGNVVLEDDVEIGSCTCIDRGKFGATRIGAGSKIDNLCQIAHNVQIGRMCMISGHTGIAGSAVLGDGVQMGGGGGLAPHIHIGAGVRIAARAAVMSSIPAGETWGGYPAQEIRHALREEAALRRLAASAKPLLKLLKDQ